MDGSSSVAYVDLHMHSTASDGSRSPSEVVKAAKQAGLSAIALTDHDTVGGLGEAAAAGSVLCVRVVNGVELSAVEGTSETHVLGLHLQDVSVLETGLSSLRDMRVRRAREIVAKLVNHGVHISFDDVLFHAGTGAVGRPHVARALVGHGWAIDTRDAFERYLAAGRPAYVAKDQLTMVDAITMIHSAGGLAILAHPGGSATKERIAVLVEQGLDGVEIKHPSHSPSDTSKLQAVCDDFGLVASGGSDWHGASQGARTIGMMQVSQSWLEKQDAVIAMRTVAPAIVA